MPELSVAVGSVQETVVPVTPLLTVVETSLMQAITGAMVSTDERNAQVYENLIQKLFFDYDHE